jgi:elongation factor 2
MDLNLTENIRNFVICAHIDAGKSTLSDSILGMGNLINFDNIGEKRGTDTRPDEIERGITIKSTGVSVGINWENKDYMLNLIDTPGHSDFSMNVSASLKITDGCVVVLDAVSGIETQTITVLRQALSERVKPILVINKFDRLIQELKLDGEEAYIKLVKMIGDVNTIINEYQSDDNKWLNTELSPNNNNVVFTCAYRNWGWDLDMFANYYSSKSGKPKENFMKVLWGDYYIDSQTQQITTTPTGKRVFSEYIYKPMKNLFDAIMENNIVKYTNILKKFDWTIQSDEKDLVGSDLYKKLFRRIYPLSPVLKKVIVLNLPSPITAQKYRVDILYDGPLNESDLTYLAIKNCDPKGPLMFYASLMVPADKNGGSRFNAFGRIFSGTIKAGDKVTIIGENYEPGTNKNIVFGKNVQKVIKMVASKTYTLDFAESGQIIALCGIDQYLLKSGTITSNTEIKWFLP